MKKFAIILAIVLTTISNAQEIRQLPMISVTGEGKIKVIPDQVFLSFAVESKGTVAKDVKRQNDALVDKVVKYLKSTRLPKEDYVTRRVSLNPQYDYNKKSNYFVANQTIEILFNDLALYDEVMAQLVELDVNKINQMEFRSSEQAKYEQQARREAVSDAKTKAMDFVAPLGQKVGKAHTITDNSSINYPQPLYSMGMKAASDSMEAQRETLAVGEIVINANVQVSFILE